MFVKVNPAAHAVSCFLNQIFAARLWERFQRDKRQWLPRRKPSRPAWVNRLLGKDSLAAKAIQKNDDKGRHTMTHRRLLFLPNGGIVIGTPGMRELPLYSDKVSWQR
jgi:hypothetical protein